MTAPSPAATDLAKAAPELVEAVRVRLARTGEEPTPARVAAALRAERAVLGDAEVLAIARTLRADLIGAGPLESLLAAPGVTDILVNGPQEVWVDDGSGLRRTPVSFPSDEDVRRLAQRLAAAAGRRLDDASPYVDARLAGGVRLHAVLPPVAPEGTCLSLRLPPRHTFALEDLVPAPLATALRAILTARLAFLVTGGTGTGKTTLLSALLSLASPTERLLLVEDSAELRPDHPHVVRLEARPPNLEGVGGVTLRDLVRQALRMRPDRLVVGEVRGNEVVELNLRKTPILTACPPAQTTRHGPGSTVASATPPTAASKRSNARKPTAASRPHVSAGQSMMTTSTATTHGLRGRGPANAHSGIACSPTSRPATSTRSSCTTAIGSSGSPGIWNCS